ncbi:MAG: hypothetical protein ACYC7D_12115 [Nitrososphaerales archaeon]
MVRLSIAALMSLLVLGGLIVISFTALPARADQVVSTIPVPQGTLRVAVDSNTNVVYVANTGSISVIDGSTYQVTATIPFAGAIFGIAVDPSTNTLYVAISFDSNTEEVYVISGATNRLTDIIQLPNEGSDMFPLDVAVDSVTNMVYVTSGFIGGFVGPNNGNLVIINGTTNAVVSNLTVQGDPQSVAVDESTNMLYVVGFSSPGNTANLVTVIDGSTNSMAATIAVPDNPISIAVDPSTDMVYVGEMTGARVAVIDGSTNTLVTQIAVDYFTTGVAVDPSTNTVYVDNARNNSVSVIDGASNELVTTIPVGIYPYGVAVNPNTDLVYVTNAVENVPGEPTVSVIQGGSPSETSFLTVLSENQNGTALTGVGVSLSIDGRVAVAGTTPDTFALNNGQSAVVDVNDYQNCVFDKWTDTGNTNSSRSITINGDTQLTALYSCNYKIVSWEKTNGLPENQPSLGATCPSYNGILYCISGSGDYYSTISSTGFSVWSATTPYPQGLGTGGSGEVGFSSCVVSSGYVYCIGGDGVGSGAHATNAVEYAPVSASGVGAWTGTTPYPVEIRGEQCLVSQGYIYCIDGSSTYYVPILASGGLGTWSQTTSYPSGITGESCATSGSEVYCVAGSTNSTYYATLSSSGIGSWTATTEFVGWNGHVCAAGDSIIYCVGGGTLEGVYYATISSSGVGNWSRTSSYPTATPINCMTEGNYIYCVDASGYGSYFSLISSDTSSSLSSTTSSTTTTSTTTSTSTTTLQSTTTSASSSPSSTGSTTTVRSGSTSTSSTGNGANSSVNSTTSQSSTVNPSTKSSAISPLLVIVAIVVIAVIAISGVVTARFRRH